MTDHFPLHVDIEPRFRDTDAMGHVNNAVYVTYLEVARQEYWRRFWTTGYSTVPFVMARIELDLRSPVKLGEIVRVELRTDWISRSSFGMSYRLTEVKSGRLVSDAKTVAVTFDYETETSMPVPDEIRQHFVEIEGRELPGKPR